MIGYSSHGTWTLLQEIYELEDDRGNFDDREEERELYRRDVCQAIWICYDPAVACRYLRDAQDYDKPITQEEINQLFVINLDGAKCIDEDGDGGYLYIRELK